jgi:3-deoxy-D-manno-octulosonic-acid transferase
LRCRKMRFLCNMMQWLYNFSMHAFALAVRLFAPFNHKAKLAVQGRHGSASRLQAWRDQHPGQLIWFHCASLGEFEQGRTLIESVRREDPKVLILLTFFSPSGYEVRKHYPFADHITYLPFDRPRSMKKMVDIARPSAVMVIKYEYWVNWFKALHERQIPIFIAAAKLRPDQRFFGIFGTWWKRTLQCVTHFYVQDQVTLDLLRSADIKQASLAGDTRFDRVQEIQIQGKILPEIQAWCASSKVIVIGSSWDEEEKIGIQLAHDHPQWKIIVVPHEVHAKELSKLADSLPNALLYSDLTAGKKTGNLMFVDTTGILSSVYQFAHVCVIGGGFGKGIHNTLEAAVWSKPVLFGPRFEKFDEAKGLINAGAALGIQSPQLLKNTIEEWIKEEKQTLDRGEKAGSFVKSKLGATHRILQHAEIQRVLKK